MNLKIDKPVIILSFGFLLIFFGFGAVQQYVTNLFSEEGLIGVGFNSLIFLYAVFTLSNPLATLLVSKYGAKKCMILAPISYFLFIISLLSKSLFLIYLASSLLGFGAALLWISQTSYLIRISDKKFYGANAGFFSTLVAIGQASGVFILGLLISKFSFKLPFLLFSIFPLIGLLLFFKLKDLTIEKKENKFKLIKKSIKNITALKISSFYFSFSFVVGLIMGIIPIKIKSIMGISYVGILSVIYFLLPIFVSYIFGRFSDIKGRKSMIFYSYLIGIAGLFSLYFSKEAFLLVLGIVLLTLNFAIAKPISSALTGDVSNEKNLEFLVALFWIIQGIGFVVSLFLSRFIQTDILYLISIGVMVISLILLTPLFRSDVSKIKGKLANEIN